MLGGFRAERPAGPARTPSRPFRALLAALAVAAAVAAESGSARTLNTQATWPFTGSVHNGTESFFGGNSRALGATTVRVGRPNSSGSGDGPIGGGASTGQPGDTRPFYGLSFVFTVTSEVVAVNAVPVFTDTTTPVAREVAENTDAGEDVGAPVAATDTDTSDTLTYSLGGADAASFDIDTATGQIQTKSGVTYDHETKASYSVEVSVTDDTATVTIAVTISVTDVAEPPETPAAPTVGATAGTADSLDVRWAEPVNTGPPITDYDVEYRKDGSGNTWSDWPHSGTGLTAVIDSLESRTVYEVRVRATSPEGMSGWSQSARWATLASSEDFNPQLDVFEVPHDWPLIPSGLGAGSNFRLFFVTGSMRDAQSADIDVYNTFVQTAAAAGHASIQAWSEYFRVVGCTAAAHSRDNAGMRLVHDGTLVLSRGNPVYWLGGSKVADEYQDFHDGSWDEQRNGRLPDGSARAFTNSGTGNRVYTGCLANGTSNANYPLGGQQDVAITSKPYGNDPVVGSTSGTGTATSLPFFGISPVFRVAAEGAPFNNPPDFGAEQLTRSLAEHSAVSFLDLNGSRTLIGGPVTATDADSQPLTYTLLGADAGSFDLLPLTGQIRTKFDVGYDHETAPVRSVTVRADDPRGGSATVPVTIMVTDVAEQPATPAAPSVTATANTSNSLDVSWMAPGLNGGPALTGYEVQYRKGTGSWNSWSHSGTSTSTTITALDGSSAYEVRVRALNGETPSAWSPSGTGTTGRSGNSSPVFSDTTPVTRSVAENTVAEQDVGAAVAASDTDVGDTLTYSLGGADAASFGIVTTSGQIQTKVALDHETKASYEVTVTADDGHAGRTTVDVAIAVTDVAEAPGAPNAPSVSAVPAATDRLVAGWSEPANTGPDITDYDVQYRAVGSDPWIDFDHTGTALSATITDLAAGTAYEVQARATNGEGTGEWSASGTATTTSARTVVPANWSLVPSDLQVGDTFRLLFLSSTTRDATETDIAEYNTFVQTAATAGHTDIQTYSAGFRAVASTAAVDARDNTATNYTAEAKGVPIHWLGGNKAADQYEDFYDGTWDEEAAPRNESGTRINVGSHSSSVSVWSGSDHDGRELLDSGSSKALGTSEPGVGYLNWTALPTYGPLNGGGDDETNSNVNRLYGLSEVFEIGAAVAANAAPVFGGTPPLARSVAENTDAGEDVGAAVAATDTDTDDALTYSLGGADAAEFDIVATSGQIRTKSALDHETKASYSVDVSVTDDTETVTIAVTISVTDVAEPPDAPDAPAVLPTAGTTDSLAVSWTAPENTGKPDITDYDVQYRAAGSETWIAFDHTGAALSATLAGLVANTAYEVQVRATNAEGAGGWSDSGQAATRPAETEVPADWGLVPDGLAAGDRFRLLFLSNGTTTATDTDIAVYNTFVQTAAAAGHADIQDYSAGFRAVASTEDDDARDNTDTIYGDDKGVPIYWLNGNKVADQYQDFYDGSWDNEDPKDESGSDRTISSDLDYPWTGSKDNGTEESLAFNSKALGSTGLFGVETGALGSATSGENPLSGSAGLTSSVARPLYALSQVFTVGSEVTVPGNWALIPDGLEPGDKFRLLFATSTKRNAASSDIADYNAFVQTRAAAGHAAIQDYSAGFRVVGSTADDDARDNTETTYTNDDQGLPIHWLGGNQVADDYADFYDGDWDDEAGSKDESGSDRSLSAVADRPYTGSNHDGTELFSEGDSYALGQTDSGVVIAGPNDESEGAGPLSSNIDELTPSNTRPFYALSQVFVVEPETPVPSNWALKPSGLSAGDRFRLLFATSTTRNGSSTDIADYNTHVQTAAAGGHAAIQDYSSWFRAVASTADDDARDNTATTTTADDTGVPIYWLGGAKVADEYADFYDGTWDDEANSKNESGSARTLNTQATWPFTGSVHNGTESFFGGNSRALGATTVRVGRPNSSGSGDGPIGGGASTGQPGDTRPFYGLSFVFTVTSEVVAVNAAPVFTDTTTPVAREVAENTDAGEDVGAPVAATDTDVSDTLTYSLGGTDAASFDIVTTSGQIRTKAALDHETKDSYSVEVNVTDDTATVTVAVTISVTDVNEPPTKPPAPTVAPGVGGSRTLLVTWTASSDNGGPPVGGYRLRYRKAAAAAWTSWPILAIHPLASETITGLDPATAYDVQVQAYNDEANSAWSDAGTGTTAAPPPAGYPLVSNLSESAPSGVGVRDSRQLATAFTTGSHPGGYVIHSVSLDLTRPPSRPAASAIAVTIRADSSGSPGDTLITLTQPAGTVAVSVDELTVAFSAPAGSALAAETTYFVVAAPDTGSLTVSYTGNDGDVSDFGWSIADGSRYASTGSDWADRTYSMSMRVDGLPAPAVLPPDSALIPDGLEPGDRFRLLFATSTSATASENRDASSTDIADYNTFVQGRAAAGHDDIQAYSSLFRVVASTAAVDARDNTATTTTGDDTGLPIYWLGGARVADDYADFYDGDWDDEANPKDESGSAHTLSGTTTWPFTGSNHNGTAHSSNFLGAALVSLGLPSSSATGDGPLTSNPGASAVTQAKTNARPFYALSPVFEVGSEVTVPSNWALKPTGLSTGDAFRLLFATSNSRQANTTSIGPYNTHVQNRAAAGHAAIQDYSAFFRVVGSTAGTDARDNTGTTHTDDDLGVPIYWLGGNQVADHYKDFYDGDWDDEANAKDESGDARDLYDFNTGDFPWTGSKNDGTEAFSSTNASQALGSQFVRAGVPNSDDSGDDPLSSSQNFGSSSFGALYALSPVFRVGSEVVAVNAVPVFTDTTTPVTRSVAENTDAGEDVGAPVAATDTDVSDTLTYSLGGTDAASFDIVTTSGQIQTKAALNYEAKDSYSVTVSVTDDTETVTIAVNISVTDVAEPPDAPDAPAVLPTAGTADSLDVRWAEPVNTGPPITDYDVEYRKDGSGNTWSDWPHSGTGLTAVIDSLESRTVYEVRVRATSPEGMSGWSQSARWATLVSSEDFTPQLDVFEVPHDWPLIPSGLGAGSNFRLFFVTGSMRDAQSADIDVYNTFVQTAAAAGHTGIQAWSEYFRVVGCTAAAHSRDNAGMRLVHDGTLVLSRGNPVYWLGGSKVADEYQDFHDGSWDEQRNGRLPDGSARAFTNSGTGNRVYTGCLANGTSNANYPLGGQQDVAITSKPYGNDPVVGSTSGTGTATSLPFFGISPVFRVAAEGAPFNNPPDFGAEQLTRSLAEHSAVSFLDLNGSRTLIGGPVTATDADSQPLTYTLLGADAGSFDLLPLTGQIRTKFDVGYDHETAPVRSVTVRADDPRGGSATVPVTIMVTDAAEQPATPAAPSVTATANTSNSLDVSWMAPGLNGGPALTGYEVQYRKGTGSWNSWSHSGTSTSTTITALDGSSAYEVRVRALNGETPSAWSPSGTGTTGRSGNSSPVFSDTTPVTRSVAENTVAEQDVGAAVAASDTDVGDTLTYSLGGADAASFGIVTTSGQIQTKVALDHETKASYEVTVTADDGHAGRTTVDVAIAVTDVAEAPGAPNAPSVSAVPAATDRLVAGWSEPANTGPDITDYDVQYRAVGSDTWIDFDHTGTALSATITDLAAGTAYEVQARATNGEGTGEWSASGTATTTSARTVVPANWSLVPSDLQVGDTFRLLFLSSTTRDATETDIAEYNTFVQTAAAAGHTDIQTYSAGFRAVASTAAVDARDNTATNYTAEAKGVPIHWLGGNKAADQYEDFYDGTWDEEAAPRNESGTRINVGSHSSSVSVWSGSDHDGRELLDSGSSKALGTSEPGVGYLNWTALPTYGPLNGGGDDETNSNVNRLYGLSEVFEIGAAVAANAAPVFGGTPPLARSVAENTGAGEDVGAVVAASDTDVGDTLSYSLEGTDAAEFDIVSTSGQIQTKSALDHETKGSYSVTVKADDSKGGTATVPVTITVTDVAEAPETPAAPTVAATANTTTSLDVGWTAPGRNGGPALTGYKLRYRKGSGSWTERTGTETGTSATIGSLDVHSEYEVQVRALNGETPSAWSPAGTGSTGNSLPEFGGTPPLARSVAENTAAGQNVGAVVAATDADTGDALSYSLEGSDAAEFDIVSTSGQIRTKSALDHETKGSYSVTVKAEDGHGGSATVAVGITVTDVAEAPETPAAPTVTATAGSTTSLDVGWTAPGRNGGPALTGYKLRYRKGSGSWTEPAGTETGTSAMIGSLDANSSYDVQVRALNGETPSAWSPTGTGSTRANSAPTFANTMESRSVAENTGSGENVGAVVTASDTDVGDTLSYSLEGTDAAEFDIVSTSGQIQTKSALDHETDASYSVTVKADDSKGGTATVPVTITVTDVAEAPETPAAPTVAATANTTTSLDVSWTAPGRNGGPALTGYKLRYRKGSGSWTERTGTETGTSATIGSLDVHSEYEVQVRALNGETPSAWSPAGTGSTGNSLPEFGGTPPLARSVAENTAAGQNVGAVVAATDADTGDALSYSLEGSDAAEFDIVSTSGQIRTKSALDHETKGSYSVTVKAEDGHGGSATVAVAITVTDVAEAPETPAAPTVTATAGSTTSLDVAWTAPGRNGGPELTGYKLRYRKGSGSWTEPSGTETGTSAMIGSLDANSSYDVQVRALNGETPSAWSPSGTGSTRENAAPTFANSMETRSVAENTAAGQDVGAVVAASDTDVGDTLSYSLEGTDAAEFDIVSTSGQIRTKSALDHETDASYSVTVKADDSKGGTATVPVTITVTDVAEAPETPAAPTVAATANTTTSLDVGWTAPGRNGGPALTGYKLRYRKGSGSWTERTGTETGTSATIGSLDVHSEYEVQVRALNGETPSAWSPTGTGSTGNSLPEFGGTPPLARSVAENTAAGQNVGAVVAATDADTGDALSYSLEGSDAAEFDIVSTSGQIRTKSALDHETKGSYSVTVKAEDGHGGSATVAVAITVTDVAEAPETPAAPTVTATAGSTTSLDVGWTAPGRNGGPELTGYKLRYRKGSGSWTEPAGTETGTSAMIGSLDANSSYDVQVRALNGETPSAWSPTGTGSTRANSAPTFANTMETRSVAENTGAGEDVGAVVAASDTDVGDTLSYSLEGTDAAEFDIVSTSGQIQTKSALDHETDASYSVTVKADDSKGGTATVPVTITVTDVAEAPETPAAPTVTATAGSTTSLDVAWTAPGRNGGPELTGYKLRYRKGSGSWTEPAGTETGTTATIGSLDANSSYDVQVRALNGETPSAWSPSGTGSTRANSAPTFANTMETRSVAENTAAGQDVGAVVAASDTDVGDTLSYSLEGTDAAEFDIVSTSGQIQTKSALDHETDASYSVTVKADDGKGGSATVPVTITVTDVAEAPETPAAPTVMATPGTTNSLDVSWTAPGRNGGPALTGYRLRHRKGASGSWTLLSGTRTGTSTTLGSLDANTAYDVQVRALNGETPSAWSPAGSGTTGVPGLSIADASASEGAGTMAFTVTLSAAAGPQVTVAYATSGGTATQGTDYTAASGTLTFAPGDTAETITVALTEDALAEGDETFEVTLSSAQNATLADATATGTITDNDQVSTEVELSLDPDSVPEGGGGRSIRVTVALDGAARATATPVTVSWTATGTATAGTDYPAVSSFPMTIPAQQTSTVRTLHFTPTDDNVAEGDETIVLRASATGLTPGEATLTIRDDETASTALALSASPARVSESGGARTVTLTASLDAGARETATTVTVSRTGGDATSGTDYAAVSNLTLTIPARQASGTATFPFTPLDDTDEEGNETVVLTATTSAPGLSAGTATLTINDDESIPTAIRLSLDPSSVDEDAGSVSVTVTAAINRGVREAATAVRVSVRGDSAASGEDFEAVSPFTVTIPAGAPSASGSFRLQPVDDAIAERTETIEVFGTAAGLLEGRARLRIRDDDERSGTVTLSVSPSSVSESAGSQSVRVTATLDGSARAVATNVVVTLASQEARFGPGRDAAVVEPFTITIAAGRTSASRSFTLRPYDDDEAEGTESIEVRGEATGLRVESATLELTDNDRATVNLAVPYVSRHSEGGGATHVTVEATLGTVRTTETVVTVRVRGSGRSGVVGFEAVPDFELTIPAGQLRGEAGFDLQPVNDDQAERDETLTISGRASGVRVTGTTFLLEDDDSASASTKVTLELSETQLAESGGAHFDLTVTGTLDGAARTQDTVVTLEATNRASDGSEVWALVDSGMRLTIRAGQISGRRTFGIVLNTPGIDQANGRLTLGGTADGLTVEAATLELLDGDDAPDLITLTLSETRVLEGWRGTVWVRGEMTPGVRNVDTVVTLRVRGTGATGAVGFHPVEDFTLTIPKEWELYEASFELVTKEDGLPGRDETLTVSGTTGVSGLRVQSATMVLTDRDGAQAEHFAHFANGGSTTSELVLLNVAPHAVRPAIYFHDPEGQPLAAESVVEVTGGLEVTEDGALTVRTKLEPLGTLTIATHGDGEPVSGSVTVRSDGPLAGTLRYRVPEIGVAGVGASPPVRDVLFPARQAGGIRTAAALHNPGAEPLAVSCRLMGGGVALEEVEVELAANAQTLWTVDEAFAAAATSDFQGSVRCTAPGEGLFTAVALELDAEDRILAALPMAPVALTGGGGDETVLDFPQFANGTGITSEMVFVNLSPPRRAALPSPRFASTIPPSRPVIYFHDAKGDPIAPASVVQLGGDLRITGDGGLTVWTEMEPLEALTIATHGQGELVSGSVRVVSEGPLGGFLRFGLPQAGVGVTGASTPLSEALFPVRRQEGGVTTRVAIHNLESTTALVRCELVRGGAPLDVVSFPLVANGQLSRRIEETFPAADTPAFVGSVVRCGAAGTGRFTATVLETDPGAGIFTALPVAPVPQR